MIRLHKPREEEWRLRLDFHASTDLDGFLRRLRDPSADFEEDPGSALGDHVVLTHDGSTFFAYTSSERALANARGTIESALREEHRHADVRVSYWDETQHDWLQTDPLLTPEEQEEQARATDERETRANRANTKPETRSVVCVTGKLIRKAFERQMVSFAEGIGLRCEIVEHPHLLSTQIAFQVTGPRSAVEQFATYLASEARASSRIDPGLIPFGLP